VTKAPYQSRLFKLIVRRSNSLKDRLGRATRSARNTLSLGFQIVLYPVYLLVQSARLAGTRLGQAVQQQLSPLTETPTAPIDRLWETITDPDTPVTGIATDLASHDLQVVIAGNEAIALPDQVSKEQLQKQITAVLANYYYEVRQFHRLSRKNLSLPPTFAKTREKILPPVRWFWDLIRWQQTGPVAMAIDLFGESSLLVSRPSLPAISPPPISVTPILLALDRQFVDLERKSLATVPLVPTSLVSLEPAILATVPETPLPDSETSRVARWYRLLYEAIEYFLNASGIALDDRPESLSLPGTAAISQRAADDLEGERERDPFTIAQLIQAAIDHFFAPPPSEFLPVTDDDPWLDVADLFATINPDPEEPPTPIPALPASNRRQYTQKKISQEKKPKTLQKVIKSPLVPKRSTPPPEPLDPEIDEPWEVQYTPIGYEKHILERVLECLDRIILAIEEGIIRVWQWWRSRKRHKKSRRQD
jgi:hypothetical protein